MSQVLIILDMHYIFIVKHWNPDQYQDLRYFRDWDIA